MFAGSAGDYWMMGMEVESSFNQPLNNWDVSSVTNMKNMFHRASSFNQPLNDWDVSSVTNMESMFALGDPYNFDYAMHLINMGWNCRHHSINH